MFKRIFAVVIAVMFAMTPLVYGATAVQDEGTYEGEAVTLNFEGVAGSLSGSTYTIDHETGTDGRTWTQSGDADSDPLLKGTDDGAVTIYEWDWTGEYRQESLSLLAWDNVAYDVDDAGRTSSASPYHVYVAGGADYIVFPGNTPAATQTGSPIEYTFIVPDDYRTTPTFVLGVANSTIDHADGEDTPNYIDWDIVINSDGSAVSTTRYDQTPVTLDADVNFQAVTLTYATPTDITAGDTITLRIWRVYEAVQSSTGRDATSDLRLYSARFRYIAQW